MNETQEPVADPGRRVRRALAFVFGAALALLLVHALFVECFLVNGSSMDPTVHELERVVVVKVLAGSTGNLVVFKNPLDPTQNVIKRIVAQGGDRVQIRAGHVFVNGRELDEPYLVHPSDRDGSDGYAETEVPANHVFVLGDNRAVSQDSRRFGSVDARQIVGRAVFVLWPPRSL